MSNKDPFNFHNLITFKEIVMQGSFSAAAKKLNCSQGHLSSIIMSMESSCGIQLFTRNHNGSSLTPQGISFLSAVNNFLVYRDDFLHAITTIDKSEETVTIHAPPSTLYYISKVLLPDFYHKHPNISIAMHKLQAGDDYDYDSMLEKTDIIISLTPSKLPSAINRKIIFKMGFYIAPSLLEKNHIRSPEDLLNIPCITISNYGFQSNRWIYTNENGDTVNLDVEKKYLCVDIPSAIYLATRGLGAIYIPVLAAAQYTQNGKLTQLFPTLPTQKKPMYLIYTNLTQKKRNSSIFLKELINHANYLNSCSE